MAKGISFEDALKTPETVYKMKFDLSPLGKTWEERSEYMANYFLENEAFFHKIENKYKVIYREDYSYIKRHLLDIKKNSPAEIYQDLVNKKKVDQEGSKRIENWLAKGMVANQKAYPFIGKLIDFEIPLKIPANERRAKGWPEKINNGLGKIDLIAYDGKTLYLIELKNQFNEEPLIRCILEIATYCKTVNTDTLLKKYNLPADTKIQPTILVFSEKKQYKHISLKKTAELMKKLKIEMFLLKETDTFVNIVAQVVA